MTDGRFETVHNCRPPGWDTRNFWAKNHHCECAQDHMERESCPFHDLRALGCFQPEYGLRGPYNEPHTPMHLNKRPDGRGMKAGAGTTSQHFGVGGGLIPFDTDPHGDPFKKARGTGSKPWACTAPKMSKGVFGPVGPIGPVPPPAAPPADAEPMIAPAGPVKAPFRGGKGGWSAAAPHMPDPYGVAPPAKHPFRLSTGKPKAVPHHPAMSPATKEVPKSAGRLPMLPRPVFDGKKPLHGTFNYFQEHMPQPWAPAAIKKEPRPIFTYEARSKRDMPIRVPWTHGQKTMEAIREE